MVLLFVCSFVYENLKKGVLFLIVILIWGCDTENAVDCFQRTGKIIRKKVDVPEFDRIWVYPNIELIVKEGDFAVVIESGDNLMEEVTAQVENKKLILENTNDCNLVRRFNETKIYVTAPNIKEIRSATQFDVRSDGVLSYPGLALVSENYHEDIGNVTGTFHLSLDSNSVSVVANGISAFFINGKTNSLNLNFAAGLPRFEGAELIAQRVHVFHRGANQIIVNPQASLTGEIRSTGDVIAVNKPDTIDVQTFYTGELLFE